MQIIGVVITVALAKAIILFEVAPEKSAWSNPVKQADEHMLFRARTRRILVITHAKTRSI
ncbi:MAG: hypothetical protein WCC17_04555 [Candidatus Nitrosopolaris sp.]